MEFRVVCTANSLWVYYCFDATTEDNTSEDHVALVLQSIGLPPFVSSIGLGAPDGGRE